MRRTGFKRKIRKPMKRGTLSKSAKKPTTKTKLSKDLWKLFSKFIRERDGYKCFTCDKVEWPSQAGHYRTGATCRKYLYFDERNVHSQCYSCNINKSGNWYEYQKRMHVKYGIDIDHQFDTINQKDGWDYPYEEKIEYYKKIAEQYVEHQK